MSCKFNGSAYRYSLALGVHICNDSYLFRKTIPGVFLQDWQMSPAVGFRELTGSTEGASNPSAKPEALTDPSVSQSTEQVPSLVQGIAYGGGMGDFGAHPINLTVQQPLASHEGPPHHSQIVDSGGRYACAEHILPRAPTFE